jgi:hypothetical protein
MDDKYPEILTAMRLLREVDNNLFVDACVTLLYEQGFAVYPASNAIDAIVTKLNNVMIAINQPNYYPTTILPMVPRSKVTP